MTDFDQALENSLDEITNGASNLDDCLLRYPEHAAQLKPLLQTAARLKQGRDLQPSTAFKARTRAKLTLHMQAYPRKRAQSSFIFWQWAANLTMIVLMFLLVTGTAYAQGTLPGDPFYNWKLVSERIWRAVSPNPVKTDIAIANRRIEEMNAVADNPDLLALALAGYQEVIARLETELDAQTLKDILPQINPTELPQQPVSTSTSILSITPTLPTSIESATPQVESASTSVPTLPVNISTAIPTLAPTNTLPKIVPTSVIPTSIPTIQVPSLP